MGKSHSLMGMWFRKYCLSPLCALEQIDILCSVIVAFSSAKLHYYFELLFVISYLDKIRRGCATF